MNNRMTPDGSVTITVTGCNFMLPVVDEPMRAKAVEVAIATDIANQVVSKGVSDFDITMSCTLMGSNELSVAINGNPPIPYSAPSYCDSAFTPVVGAGENSIASLSHDMNVMLNTVFDSDGIATQYHQMASGHDPFDPSVTGYPNNPNVWP